MTGAHGYWFKSTLFDIEPGEDLQTNPRRYGKQLAHWLASKLADYGYSAEINAEDWGWSLTCGGDSFVLQVVCANIMDARELFPPVPPPDELPRKEGIVWHCFVIVKARIWPPFFWKRRSRRADMTLAATKLNALIGEILTAETEIKLVEEC